MVNNGVSIKITVDVAEEIEELYASSSYTITIPDRLIGNMSLQTLSDACIEEAIQKYRGNVFTASIRKYPNK